MSTNNQIQKVEDPQMSKLEQVLIQGDLAKLTPDERVFYYKKVCDSVGLNSLTQPFSYITLNGKLTLYALRAATDQLRTVRGVSIQVMSRELIGDVYVVTARAKMGEREDESTGAVNITGLKGEMLANAYMKAETKAKRRVTLSICGLGLLDETEVDSIPKQAIPLEQPRPGDGAPAPYVHVSLDKPEEFKLTFGKFRLKTLRQIGVDEVASYRQYLINQVETSGKEPRPEVAEFLEYAKAYLERNTPVADSVQEEVIEAFDNFK